MFKAFVLSERKEETISQASSSEGPKSFDLFARVEEKKKKRSAGASMPHKCPHNHHITSRHVLLLKDSSAVY